MSGGEDELEGEPASKRRRGRPSRDDAAVERKDEQTAEAATSKKKRGRPKATQVVVTAEEAQDEASEAPTRKKRWKTRVAQDAETPTEHESARRRGLSGKSDGPDVANTKGTKTRGRARQPDAEEVGEEVPELRKRGGHRRSDGSDAAAEAPGPRNRGRPRRAEQPSPPKKRGRPRRSDASEVTEEHSQSKERRKPRHSDVSDTKEQPPRPKKRGRPRQSDTSDAGPSQPRPSTEEPNDTASPDPPSPDQPRTSYPFLAAKQREIPVATISSTWTPLQPPSLTLARQILHFSERPVLQSLAPGPRRDVAASAIRTASKRLSSKLSKGLPFPPASKAAIKASKKSKIPRADGREAELDFEAVASEMEALEGRLDPLLHSVEVLRAEERRMEGVLSREVAELEVLERNGREERKLWREGLRRKGHPLVPDRWDPDGDGGDRLVLAPKGEEVSSEWLFTVCQQTIAPPSPSVLHPEHLFSFTVPYIPSSFQGSRTSPLTKCRTTRAPSRYQL